MNTADILVVGAGPVGLTMAAELARHGVRPRIVDRLPTPSPYCRAIGVTSRTLEVWDDMGIVRPMIDAGLWITGVRSVVDGKTRDEYLDLHDLPYSMLGLPQYETERILTRHLTSYGIAIERATTLEALTPAAGPLLVTLVNAAGQREQTTFRYVVGCDGAHSAVRKGLGISFEGAVFPAEFILGDVHIDWDLPRGLSMRALHPVPDAPPDMFIAVPLPELGRYRVSMLAPATEDNADAGSGHGIQSERPAPGLDALQIVADRLVPGQAKLSDLRWSSVFRISMRLAGSYRQGNAFLAGDAAHIHPPTGGQGMNTGIQDAYNLAWKIALVLRGAASETLLDSYEAERLPVGKDVVERTTAASVRLGREQGDAARLADTQVLISYRGSPWVADAPNFAPEALGPRAGDRVPDCAGLRRAGLGHSLRLFDVLRGTEHVFLVHHPGRTPMDLRNELAEFITPRWAGLLRVVAIVPRGTGADLPNVAWYADGDQQFQKVFGAAPTYLLVRPDGHLAWRGNDVRDGSLSAVVKKTLPGAIETG